MSAYIIQIYTITMGDKSSVIKVQFPRITELLAQSLSVFNVMVILGAVICIK